MEAKNLRIGNFVKVNNQEYHPKLVDEILVVIGVNQTDNLEKNGRTHSISMNYLDDSKNYVIPAISQLEMFVQGIELTDINIQEFGYTLTDTNSAGNVWNIVEIGEFINEDCQIIYFNKTKEYKRGNLRIKYVHELQNLFFAITGTELQYEELP
jgi:hypothetical protein